MLWFRDSVLHCSSEFLNGRENKMEPTRTFGQPIEWRVCRFLPAYIDAKCLPLQCIGYRLGKPITLPGNVASETLSGAGTRTEKGRLGLLAVELCRSNCRSVRL